MTISTALLALTLVLPAPHAFAQETSRTAGIDVHVGQRVWITTDDGAEHAGRIDQLTPAAIALDRGAGATLVPLARIRRIEATDTLGNGIAIGTAAGFAGLGGVAAWVTNAACDNEGGTCGLSTIGRLTLFGIVGAGAGAGVGALVDALHHGRRTIYEHRGVTIAGGPVVSRGVRGVSMSIRW